MSLIDQDPPSLSALISELGCSDSGLLRELQELVDFDHSMEFVLSIRPLPVKSIEFDILPLVQKFLGSQAGEKFWSEDNPKLILPEDKVKVKSLLVHAVWTIVQGKAVKTNTSPLDPPTPDNGDRINHDHGSLIDVEHVDNVPVRIHESESPAIDNDYGSLDDVHREVLDNVDDYEPLDNFAGFRASNVVDYASSDNDCHEALNDDDDETVDSVSQENSDDDHGALKDADHEASGNVSHKGVSDDVDHHEVLDNTRQEIFEVVDHSDRSSMHENHDRELVPDTSDDKLDDSNIKQLGISLYNAAAAVSSSSPSLSSTTERNIMGHVRVESMDLDVQPGDMHGKIDHESAVSKSIALRHGQDTRLSVPSSLSILRGQDAKLSAPQEKDKTHGHALEPVEFNNEEHLLGVLLDWIIGHPRMPLPGGLKYSGDRIRSTLPTDAYASEDVNSTSIGKVERLKVDEKRMGWILRLSSGKIVWLLRTNNFVRNFAQYRGWLGEEALFTSEPLAYTTRPQYTVAVKAPVTLPTSLGKRRASNAEEDLEAEEEEEPAKRKARDERGQAVPISQQAHPTGPIKEPEDLPGGYPSYFRGTTAGVGQAKDSLSRSGATVRNTPCAKCEALNQPCFNVGKCERCLYCIAKFVKSALCKPSSLDSNETVVLTSTPSSKVGRRAKQSKASSPGSIATATSTSASPSIKLGQHPKNQSKQLEASSLGSTISTPAFTSSSTDTVILDTAHSSKQLGPSSPESNALATRALIPPGIAIHQTAIPSRQRGTPSQSAPFTTCIQVSRSEPSTITETRAENVIDTLGRMPGLLLPKYTETGQGSRESQQTEHPARGQTWIEMSNRPVAQQEGQTTTTTTSGPATAAAYTPRRRPETMYNFLFGGVEAGPSLRNRPRRAPMARSSCPTKEDFFATARQFWLFNRADPRAATLRGVVYAIQGSGTECFIWWDDQRGYDAMVEAIEVAEGELPDGARLEVDVSCLEPGMEF